jgi:hypothetical protein
LNRESLLFIKIFDVFKVGLLIRGVKCGCEQGKSEAAGQPNPKENKAFDRMALRLICFLCLKVQTISQDEAGR